MNINIMIAAGFSAEVALMVEAGQCPFCQMPVNNSDFKDELSRKEFQIGGFCQSCQDEVFAEDDVVVTDDEQGRTIFVCTDEDMGVASD